MYVCVRRTGDAEKAKNVQIKTKNKVKEETKDTGDYVCARCIIHNTDELIMLNKTIDVINDIYAKNGADDRIMRVGIGTDENNTNITLIDIAPASCEIKTRLDINTHRETIRTALGFSGIEFSFIPLSECFRNTYDRYREAESGYNLLCIEKSEIGDDAFGIICKALNVGINPSDVYSIRIPVHELITTEKEELVTGDKPEMEPNNKVNDSGYLYVTVSILDKNMSLKFDSFIQCCTCRLIDIVSDYIESTKEKYFRTVHIHVPNSEVGFKFCDMCARYGEVSVNPVSNKE